MHYSEFTGKSAGLSFPNGGTRDSGKTFPHGATLAWGGGGNKAVTV